MRVSALFLPKQACLKTKMSSRSSSHSKPTWRPTVRKMEKPRSTSGRQRMAQRSKLHRNRADARRHNPIKQRRQRRSKKCKKAQLCRNKVSKRSPTLLSLQLKTRHYNNPQAITIKLARAKINQLLKKWRLSLRRRKASNPNLLALPRSQQAAKTHCSNLSSREIPSSRSSR